MDEDDYCEKNPWTCRCPQHYDPKIVELQRKHQQRLDDAIEDLDDDLVDQLMG